MEELQDAIEDAQYVNAIATQEDGPKPVLPWEIPTEEQLAEWEAKVRAKECEKNNSSKNTTENPIEPFTLEWTMRSAIGYFLFSSFVKTKCEDYCRINFCEDVVRFKMCQGGGRQRLDKARLIFRTYLKGPPARNAETGEFDAASLPPRTEIDEDDLERKVPNLNLTAEQMESLYKVNMDHPTCSETVVGLKGPVMSDLVKTMKDVEDAEILRKTESMPAGHFQEAPMSSASFMPEEAGGGSKNSKHDLASNDSSNLEKLNEEEGEDEEEDNGPASGGASGEGNNNIGNSNSNDNNSNDGSITKEKVESATTATAATATTTATTTTATMGYAKSEELKPPIAMPQLPPEEKKGHSHSMHEQGLRGITNKLRNNSVRNSALTDNLFDRAEAVVVESLRRNYWDRFVESEEYQKVKHFLWYQDRRVVPDDFFSMRVLGRGGFGLVTACKKGTSGKLYAMKIMNKRRIKMKKSEQLASNERQALAAVESKFVVNLKYSFHSKDDVFLILDLMTGGDLGYHLHQKGRFPRKECQYYAARIMLGLQALHDKRYVYRDLKPENCLLAEDGRVKITDLGLATRITPTLHGAAGTRGYWAPEMLRRDKKGRRMPYGHTVDWFSFGCCVAEFISGANPFRSEAALNFGLERGKQTKEKAIDCATLEMTPEFNPEKFEPDAADLCRRLLDKNEKTRLGYHGCEEIMAHPWFKSLNWEAIISDRKRPPFIPAKDVNAASQSEIGTFAEDKAYQETVVTESDESVYKDWDWTNPRAFAAEVIEFLIYERETGEPLLPVAHGASCCCAVL